ncbi:MAG: PQQ-like beta-propeller repeat protein, partial [Planctomycetales bacterium]|nr:PQQ-like beta-propeller repeat protein [Planctomycetales bacterium]
RFVGIDKRTGAAVWFSGTTPKPKDTTYSSPFLTTFNGEAAMVFGSGDGMVHAMQPRTGKIIWSYQASNRGINTSPVVVDNMVYCGFHEQSSADTRVLGGIFALNGLAQGTIPEEDVVWKIPGELLSGGQPLVVDGRLYVVDLFGKLIVADASNGKVIQEKKVGRRPGSLVYGDGKIYCIESTGMFWVFEPVEEGVKEITKVRLNNHEVLTDPVIWHGRIYLTTSEGIYCIGSADAEPTADAIPAPPAETPVSEDQTVAQLQLAPVEVILAPGQSTPYQVRAYNAKGQFLKLVDAEFSVEGGGEMSAEGVYTAPSELEHRAVFLTAKQGDVTTTARGRIIPPLPWKFDFNDKKVPITWNGASYRHQPKDLDGEPVLVKISTIPLGTRSQCWMGWTTLHDYTIQADVYSTKNEENGEKADMGLINQRYTLDLMGKDELQIRSWTPRLENRFAKTIPFAWETDQWYTLKFQSENKDGKAILRGKVWKRGEEEPSEWAIEAADATPNVSGSPGLFGKSTNAEFYIDNVEVTKN